MELYMMNRQHGRMILESVENGPLIWPTIEENGVTRLKKYSELSATEVVVHSSLRVPNIKVTSRNPSKVNIKQLCAGNPVKEVLLKLNLSGHRINRWRYNLTPAESKFKTPMLDHQDKYMMKAQVHVLKSSVISDIQALPRRKHYCQIFQVVKHKLRGRLLAKLSRSRA
nr:hypothetical protein [Tanacetum cinerariifolium]